MNKEYKLLKKYPSLATDWEVGMKVGLGDRNYGYSPCAGNYSDCRKLDNSEVENNSEYWELVMEKEYEILSFYNKDNKSMYFLKGDRYCNKSDGTYYSDIGTRTLDYCMKYYNIHSIKRISDGEVFFLNDKVKLSGKYSEIWLLKEIDNKGIFRFINNPCGYSINLFIKVKEPLLVTEDGVEMFGYRRCYIVSKKYLTIQHSVVDNINIMYLPDFNFYFAEKENAEKYIKENQKRYSLNDMKETVNKLGCFGTTLIEYLENEI